MLKPGHLYFDTWTNQIGNFVCLKNIGNEVFSCYDLFYQEIFEISTSWEDLDVWLDQLIEIK